VKNKAIFNANYSRKDTFIPQIFILSCKIMY
jgi:hypothetical protein